MLPTGRPNTAHGYALVSTSDSPTLRAALGSVLYLVLSALPSLGVPTAIRDIAVSIRAVLGLLHLPPSSPTPSTDPLRRHLQQIAPMTAGLAIQAITNLCALPSLRGLDSASSPPGPSERSLSADCCYGCGTHEKP
jgi:ABC-2 type transport system permease protein